MLSFKIKFKSLTTSFIDRFSFLLQKHDSDLIFEDSFGNPLSDDKISNQLNENSRTKLVSKSDSDKQKVEDNQSSWLSRVKRSLSSFFASDDKVVEKRESNEKPLDGNKSQDKVEAVSGDYRFPSRRRRQIEDDEEDDDEDNEIGSGDQETTSDPSPVTPLPAVKDDKYCK